MGLIDDTMPLSFDASQISVPAALEAALTRIRVEPVLPIDEQYRQFGARVLLVHGVLSEEECQSLVDGFGTQTRAQGGDDQRVCVRKVLMSDQLSSVLYSRLQPVLDEHVKGLRVAPHDYKVQHALDCDAEEAPPELRLGYTMEGDWRHCGINEYFRLVRYDSGGFFRLHTDGGYVRSQDERGLYTCMLYLNGGFEGGRTRFMPIDLCLPAEDYRNPPAEKHVIAHVTPEPGMCILFFQKGLLHDGEPVGEGVVKYILRTEVMFKRVEGSRPPRSEKQLQAASLLEEAVAAEENNECTKACELYRKAFKLDPELERTI